MARVRRGDLAAYCDQAIVLTTKGFSLCRGHFRRGEIQRRSKKTRRKSRVRRVCGADTPPLRPTPVTTHNTAQTTWAPLKGLGGAKWYTAQADNPRNGWQNL